MRLVLLVQPVIAMWREKSSLTGLLIFLNIITGPGTLLLLGQEDVTSSREHI